jgi:transcriptional regulator with XRE-family HTH domain
MARVSFAERLNEIMGLRNVSQAVILEMAKPLCERDNIKLTKSKLSQYVSGKHEPKDNGIVDLLAEVLDVNPAWLDGYDVPMKREMLIGDESTDELTKEVDDLIRRLTPFEQKRVLAELRRKASEL